MPRVKVLKPFFDDRITGVFRDGKEIEVEGQVRPGDEFDADPIFARDASRLGTVEIAGGGDVTDEDVDAQELVPAHNVSQNDIDRQNARRSGRPVVGAIAGPVVGGSAGTASRPVIGTTPAARTADNQARPSIAPTTTARPVATPAAAAATPRQAGS